MKVNSLPETQDYIEKAITTEYEFQRKEYSSGQGFQAIGLGLTWVGALAAFVALRIPHCPQAGDHFTRVTFWVSVVGTLVFGFGSGVRLPNKSIDRFSIEDVLTRARETAVSETDREVLDWVKTKHLEAVRKQIYLCRRQNVGRVRVYEFFMAFLLVSLVSGSLLALVFSQSCPGPAH